MRVLLYSIFFIYLLLPAINARTLVLSDIINLTLKQSPNVKLAELSKDQTFTEIDSAQGNFDSNISLSYTSDKDDTPSSTSLNTSDKASSDKDKVQTWSFTYSKTFKTGTELSIPYTYAITDSSSISNTLNQSHQPTFEFTLTQPLLKLFSANYFKKDLITSHIDYLIGILDFDESKQDEIIDSIELFFEFHEQTETLKIKSNSLKSSKTQFQFTNKQNRLGKKSTIDVLDSKSKMLKKEIEFLETQTLVTEKRLELANQLDLEDTNNLQVAHVFEDPSATLKKIEFNKGADSYFLARPDFQIGIKETRIKSISLVTAKADMLPDVELSSTYSLTGLNKNLSDSHEEIQDSDFTGWQFGLTVTHPLMRYAKRASKALAELKLKQEILKQNQLKREISFELQQNENNLKIDALKINSFKIAKGADGKRLKAANIRYRNGMISLLEYNEALEDFEKSSIDLLKANISFVRSSYALMKSRGELLKH
jgi:outer membrane protein TolC